MKKVIGLLILMMCLIVSVPAQSEFNFDQQDLFMDFDSPTYEIITVDYTETWGSTQTFYSGLDEVGTVDWGWVVPCSTAELFSYSNSIYDVYVTDNKYNTLIELPNASLNEGLYRLNVGDFSDNYNQIYTIPEINTNGHMPTTTLNEGLYRLDIGE